MFSGVKEGCVGNEWVKSIFQNISTKGQAKKNVELNVSFVVAPCQHETNIFFFKNY